MDKKIILSVLIVALIGIVAATYQINPGQDILNPLASVETEETPVTEVLTAPEESQQQAQAQADEQAKKQAQAEAQAQQAKDEANAQAKAQAEAQQEQSSSQAGATSQSGIINAENPVSVPSTSTADGSQSNDGSADGNAGSSDANSGSSDGNSGSSDGNGGSSNNGGATDNNGGSTDGTGDNTPGSQNSPSTPQTSSDESSTTTIDDATWSEIDSIIQKAQSKFDFGLKADRDSCSVSDNGLYKVDVYNSENNNFVGTLFININKNSGDYGNWYLVDSYGEAQGPDVSDKYNQ